MTILGSLFESRARKEGPYSVSDAGVTSFLGVDHVSSSGVTVNETTALNCTAVFACVRVLSESIASMPLVLYRRDGDGREKDTEHPVYELLRYQPNDDMTAMVWREAAVSQILLWGNHYSWIVRDRAGRVRAIHPLSPAKVTVERAKSSGELVYRYEAEPDERVPKILRSAEVLHVPGLTTSGLVGLSVVSANRDTIGLSMAATRYGASFFGQGARPGGVLSTEKLLTPEARQKLKESWEAGHQGERRWMRVAVLDGGLKWEDAPLNHQDAQFLESRQFQVEEIARMFRVPLVLLQSPVQGAVYGAGVEQLMLSFVTYTLQPYLVRFEQEIHRKLLSEGEKKTHFVEHMTDSLLRGDFKTRMEGYVQGRSWGFLSINDVRRKENYPPVVKQWGDELIVPANYVKADAVGQQINAPAPAPTSDSGSRPSSGAKSAREAFEPALIRALAEIVEREIGAVRKGSESREVDDFLPWVEGYYRDSYRRVLAERVEPLLEVLASARGIENAPVWASKACDSVALDSLSTVQTAIHAAIRRSLNSKEAVSAVLVEWSGAKVRRIVDSVLSDEVEHGRAA